MSAANREIHKDGSERSQAAAACDRLLALLIEHHPPNKKTMTPSLGKKMPRPKPGQKEKLDDENVQLVRRAVN